MDIEWAYYAGNLYLLQGRPITTDLKLPQKLYTSPTKKENLFFIVIIY